MRLLLIVSSGTKDWGNLINDVPGKVAWTADHEGMVTTLDQDALSELLRADPINKDMAILVHGADDTSDLARARLQVLRRVDDIFSVNPEQIAIAWHGSGEAVPDQRFVGPRLISFNHVDGDAVWDQWKKLVSTKAFERDAFHAIFDYLTLKRARIIALSECRELLCRSPKTDELLERFALPMALVESRQAGSKSKLEDTLTALARARTDVEKAANFRALESLLFGSDDPTEPRGLLEP